jgi:hypothetical protein
MASASNSQLITASKTRPSDTTAYAAGDVIAESTSAGTVLTFSNMSRKTGSSGLILGAMMIDSANQSTKPQVELWLFSAAPGAKNDNAAFAPTDAELETLIDIIKFDNTNALVGTVTAGADGNSIQKTSSPIAIPFKSAEGSRALYGVPVVRNAYTPVSGEKFTFQLRVAYD